MYKLQFGLLFSLSLLLFSGSICAQQTKDVEHFNDFVKLYQENSPIDSRDMLIEVGKSFLGTPYVANTLDKGDIEKLVVNLDELDCTTFIENCIALTYALMHFDNPTYSDFTSTLQDLRYQDGTIDGYASRNHYMTSWIVNNQKYVENISLALQGKNDPKQLDLMSNHVSAYPMLVKDTTQIALIKNTERELSTEGGYNYIPKTKISEILPQLRNGDIVVFATSIKGLDYSHIGMIIKDDNNTQLLHASSKYKKVIIDPKSLEQYCQDNKSCVGITVLRLK